MRLDHIAYRVKDRFKTAQFFIKAFGYRIADDLPEGFDIQFEDGTIMDNVNFNDILKYFSCVCK